MAKLEEDEKGNRLISVTVAVIGAVICAIIGFVAGFTFPR